MLTFPILQANLYHPVIAIPILLLWRVQIKLQQKLALGLSLCMSIIMTIIPIVRISGIYSSNNTFDTTWVVFWQLMEPCIAVIVVSLTALRTLLVAHAGSGTKPPRHKPSLRKRLLSLKTVFERERAGENDGEEMERLPEVPPATLTGMRTFIRGKRAERSVMKSEGFGDDEMSWPLENESENPTIKD